MNLKQLQDERVKAITRVAQLADKAEAAAKVRDDDSLTDEQRVEAEKKAPMLTDDERAEWDLLEEQAADLDKKIEAKASEEKRINDAKKRLEDLSKGTGRKTAHAQPGGGVIVAEQGKFTIPAHVRRVGSLNAFKGEKGGYSADERAYRFGMWAMAAIGNSLPAFRNPNAEQFCQDYLGMDIGAAVHKETGTATGGQYLVPEQFGQDLIDLREMYGVARRVLKVIPMNSDTRTDPRRVGGLTAYFTGEGEAGTESNKQWDKVTLTAKKLMVLARMTNELSEDSVINIGDDLASEISYAFANKEDECAFNGDGTLTYGGIVGVRTKLQDVDGAGTDSAGLKVQGTGNTWGAIVLGDFDAVVGKLPQYADTQNAVWLMHRTFYYEICEKLIQASGGVPAMEIREGRRQRPLFKGYPVEFSQVFPSATATSSVVATLGDHSLGARFGDRRRETIKFSEHATVNGQSVFERDEIAVVGTERFDVNVHDVGSSSVAGPIVGLATGSGG